MKQVKEEVCWDKKITNYTIKDIDLRSFNQFTKRIIACNQIKITNLTPKEALYKLGLAKDNHLTYAAYYLLSSLKPIALKLIDSPSEGSMNIQIVHGNIIELIDIAINFLKEKMRYKKEDIKYFQEQNLISYEIPLFALEEIIINAFAHAQYLKEAIKVAEHYIYISEKDIGIFSPGVFPIGYKPEDFAKQKISPIIRNQTIFTNLGDANYACTLGRGFINVFHECQIKHVEYAYDLLPLGFYFVFHRPENFS